MTAIVNNLSSVVTDVSPLAESNRLRISCRETLRLTRVWVLIDEQSHYTQCDSDAGTVARQRSNHQLYWQHLVPVEHWNVTLTHTTDSAKSGSESNCPRDLSERSVPHSSLTGPVKWVFVNQFHFHTTH